MTRNPFSYANTIGSNKTATMPLLDVETGGPVRLIVGPRRATNNLRLYLRVPDRDECERFPAPLGYDRKSITFEPFAIFVQGQFPANVNGKLSKIVCPEGRRIIHGKNFKSWGLLPETSNYPAIYIDCPILMPDDVMEIHGESTWKKSLYLKNIDTSPSAISYIPVPMLVLVRMKWVPLKAHNVESNIVRGSPVDHPQRPPDQILFGTEPEIELPTPTPSRSWKDKKLP